METPKAANAGPAQTTGTGKGRRRRWEMTSDNVRYFCPKQGSSQERPELGQEMPTEGDALVKAFKDGGVFYTLVAWSAVTEMDGNEPKIVKQALKRSS
jgi:hypothetical protein